MILVTGATGNVGRELVRILAAEGVPVRALTRDPAKADLPAGVEVVAGDLDDPETLQPAFAGVSEFFLIQTGVSDTEGVLDAAKRAGVQHVVLQSSSGVVLDNAIGKSHAKAESAVHNSGLNWTVLRPGAFMANTLQWAPTVRAERIVRAPFGNFTSAPIDSRDIAAVAAQTLLRSGYQGRTYTLTGPEALSTVDQVHVLGTVLGEDILFEELTETAAREQMSQYAPPYLIDALMDLYKSTNASHAQVLPTVTELTGHPARTFREWAADHIAVFQ